MSEEFKWSCAVKRGEPCTPAYCAMSCWALILQIVADHYEGTLTLNHMRVIQYITMQTSYHNHKITHKEICDTLKLSPATVTRIITFYREQSIVCEWTNPDDGRKKFVRATGSGPVIQAFNKVVQTQLESSLSICPLLSWTGKQGQ